jgi:hypothetical protein
MTMTNFMKQALNVTRSAAPCFTRALDQANNSAFSQAAQYLRLPVVDSIYTTRELWPSYLQP